MPQITVQVPHQLPVDEAVVRLQSFLDKVREDNADRISDVRGEWSGNELRFAFTAVALKIQGTLHVVAEEVRVVGNLPFAAFLFRGQIEETMRTELEKLLR
jgi:hypothetical protein